MIVPASKVKALCSASETALVRSSRKPQLEQLSATELKRLSARARKLFDKWQALGREQARARSRAGTPKSDASNTALKTQIFRDALTSFEARLAKLAKSAESTAKKSKPKTKKVRAAAHRATRAAVRKGMTAVEDLVNASARKRKR